MTAFADELAANAEYAAAFADHDLPAPAARGLAVVTCMDSRIDPLRMLGLRTGDAKVLRNPGGQVTDDVLTALVLAAHLLSVQRVLVVQHTDCRMAKVTDEQAHDAIREAGGVDTRSLVFGTIGDQRAALERDVQRVKSSPYLPPDLAVGGALYDVRSGRLELLVER
ncbi:MAG TPA: carbonic anhydrase [Mycobacteriales bacterium]|nr:carbonic anhydrase [Mycobacteriales bacterium]